jgi:formylglycine-generating enzyme required for sulfatase activity
MDPSLDRYRDAFPDFELERVLGHGAMGVVLLATQKGLDRRVAIKVISKDKIGGADVSRFRREARIYGQLAHPNLVRVYLASPEAPVPHIVLEYVEGVDLRHTIDSGARLPVAAIGRDLAGALAYIHERDIVHRDIKPANIMLRPDGKPVIMDFGVSKAFNMNATALTVAGNVVGTPFYMPPEVFDGEDQGPEGDVFALGLVLYEVAGGKPAGIDEPFHQVLAARIKGRIPRLADLSIPIAPQVDQLIAECLAPKPKNRPTAADVARRLADPAVARRIASTSGVPARGSERSERTSLPPGGTRPGPASGTDVPGVAQQATASSGPPAAGADDATLAPTAPAAPVSRPTARSRPGSGPVSRQISRETRVVVEPGRRRTAVIVLSALTLLGLAIQGWLWLRSGRDPARAAAPESPAAGPPDSGSPPHAVSRSPATAAPPIAPGSPGPPTPRGRDGAAMVAVPAGWFRMGGTVRVDADERPQHRVVVDAFEIDVFEVSNALYDRFCRETGRRRRTSFADRSPEFDRPDHPAVGLAWADARDYCAWAGKRLPTEAEWEKAARGTDGRQFPWGNDLPGRVQLANFSDASLAAKDMRDVPRDVGEAFSFAESSDGHVYTAPVTSFPDGASPYGARNMAGNVMEWCSDWYAPDTYAREMAANPTGPASGSLHVLRGGSWDSYKLLLRATKRYVFPSSEIRDASVIGCRCAMTTRAKRAPGASEASAAR